MQFGFQKMNAHNSPSVDMVNQNTVYSENRGKVINMQNFTGQKSSGELQSDNGFNLKNNLKA